jgi:1-deoxyxylulose-5-phosphate synthase
MELLMRHAPRCQSTAPIVEALGKVAGERDVSRAQIALAWLRRNVVVVAPIIGASKTSHIDDAIASLAIELTDEEAARLEPSYTPRHDFQGVSNPAELERILARIGIKSASSQTR